MTTALDHFWWWMGLKLGWLAVPIFIITLPITWLWVMGELAYFSLKSLVES